MVAVVKPRETGALALIERSGPGEIRSATGGTVTLNRAATDPSFSPLDLLYASVAGCLVVSARQAAGQLSVLDRFNGARVHVTGDKAEEGPQRVARLHVKFEIDGDFDEAMRAEIIARAEELCTVSNTLREPPEFVSEEPNS